MSPREKSVKMIRMGVAGVFAMSGLVGCGGGGGAGVGGRDPKTPAGATAEPAPATSTPALDSVLGPDPAAAEAIGREVREITASEALARELLELLAKNDFDDAAARFDATMRAALPAPKLAEAWLSLGVVGGAYESLGRIKSEKHDKFRVVVVEVLFKNVTVAAKVVVDPTRAPAPDRIAGLFFIPGLARATYVAPPYVDATRFDESEVVVGEGTPWALPGTLTRPKGDGPFPAVVLVHGSGPQDRDETVGARRPFRDLAGGLASRGIAVLRYEKRTKVHGAAMAPLVATLTVKEETIDDAVLAVKLLAATPGIDLARVFVAGHSLGGYLAPRIGVAAGSAVAGLVIIAGSTRKLEDIVVAQVEYLLALGKDTSDGSRKILDDVRASAARVKTLVPGDAAPPAAATLPLGLAAAYWLDLNAYDAPAMAAKLKLPMLVLQGGRDYQVTSADFDGWKRALGKRKDVVMKTYPALDHLLGAGEGASKPTDYAVTAPVDATLVEDLAAWVIKARKKK